MRKKEIRTVIAISIVVFLGALLFFLRLVGAKKAEEQLRERIYIFFGYPGAGKGSLAQKMKSKGFYHISTGEIFRKELQNGSALGQKYKNEIAAGDKYLPSEVINGIIAKVLSTGFSKTKDVILDGYPKTIKQAQDLETILKTMNFQGRIVAVEFDVTRANSIERTSVRKHCGQCGLIHFQKHSLHSGCIQCGNKLVRREDDTEERVNKKIRIYDESLKPVVKYYEMKSSLVRIDQNKELQDGVFAFERVIEDRNIGYTL